MKRRWSFVVAAFAIALGLTGLTFAQQRGGGGFGGGFGGGAAQPINLLNNASVKKELDVTDEQIEKLPAAIQKALSEVLNEKQAKRLRQIELQQRGVAAFTDKMVSTELKLSDDQTSALKTIATDSAKAMRGGGGFGAGGREKIEAARKEAMEKAEDVLSADQKKMWVVMTGEPFKIEMPAFGNGNFGKGKRNKKAAE
ncbi:MAG TPA: hypothetical protein VHR72_13465 [Gemmataceae bacterium]|jgi:hypothetical protein|nr:hypothetical protein [Gemmataceae bacterium]